MIFPSNDPAASKLELLVFLGKTGITKSKRNNINLHSFAGLKIASFPEFFAEKI